MAQAVTSSGLNVERAKKAWASAGGAPDWVIVLADACDKASQGKVAERLGYNGSAVVNQAIGNSYKGRMDRVESRVRGELMKEVVACPVLGEISTRDCLDHQGRKFSATNPLRVKLFKACPDCPNREDACSKE